MWLIVLLWIPQELLAGIKASRRIHGQSPVQNAMALIFRRCAHASYVLKIFSVLTGYFVQMLQSSRCPTLGSALCFSQSRAMVTLGCGVDHPAEISDPYLGEREAFEQVWHLVESAAEKTLARIERVMREGLSERF